MSAVAALPLFSHTDDWGGWQTDEMARAVEAGWRSQIDKLGRPLGQRTEEVTMGKIVSNFFISLDGVVESPEKWHMPYLNDEMGAAIGKGMETNKAFLMGRVLYEEWAAYWPDKSDDFAGFINNHPKYVVSNSLESATWNNTTIVSGDVPKQLGEIKDRIDGDIVVTGSATLVRSLLADRLLDELRVMVHPIVVGDGRRLSEDSTTHALELVGHEVFSTGVLNLTYVPRGE